jgi:hypothetical protein
MNFSNKRVSIAVIALILLALYMSNRHSEKYSGRAAYRYGFVDTNPARRVSDAFDSAEYRNVHEGLPLP